MLIPFVDRYVYSDLFSTINYQKESIFFFKYRLLRMKRSIFIAYLKSKSGEKQIKVLLQLNKRCNFI